MARPYSDYLTVNRDFVPVFSVQADREHPRHWLTFYPNQDFTDILADVASSLEGDTSEKRKSLWMSGAYGTGKSFAAFTLKHILEDDEKEVRSYFENHKISISLFNRLQSVKKGSHVLVIYRSSSSGIVGDNRLFIAIQESIKNALKENGYSYFGAKALYDNILDRLKDVDGPLNFRGMFNANKGRFTEYSSPEEVVKDLEDSEPDECLGLLETIIEVAESSGFTFGNNVETITQWINDIIKANKIKIVFIWDEFTEYFQKNQNSTSGLQELAHASFEMPFYFLLITHKRLEAFIYDQDSRKKLEARFKMHKLEMGSTTAFMLMHSAIQVVPDLQSEWANMSASLWLNVEKVAKDALFRYDDNLKKDDLKGLLPLHPFAAFLLETLAREVNSNQRTMFQFLCGDPDQSEKPKTNFRWFIESTNIAGWSYLTSDLIWDYFFFDENVDLDDSSRAAINFYNTFESQCGNIEEQRVLKVALLLTAMKQERGKGISNLLRPTLSNIVFAFTGTPICDDVRNIMDRLVRKSVFGSIAEGNDLLYVSQTQNIDEDKYKDKEQFVRKAYDFEKLISNPEFQLLSTFASATGYGAARFELISATHRDLKQKLASIRTLDNNRLPLVFLFAKNEVDIAKNQEAVSTSLRECERDVIFANASAQPLTDDEYENFVKYVALSEYHKSSRPDQALITFKLAKGVIDEWKRRINDSAQISLHTQCSSPISLIGSAQFANRISELDRKIFPYSLESMTSNDNIFKSSFTEIAPLVGMGKQQVPASYAFLNTLVKRIADDKVWNNPDYFASIPNHPLSKMKTEIEKLIDDNFVAKSSVGIADIWNHLKEKPFGLLTCTGSAFVVGFLLKEYADNGYYKKDGIKNPTMLTASELANMVVAIMKGLKNADTLSIVRMTEKQECFCKYSGKIFGLSSEQQTSIQGVMIGIKTSLENLGFPLWALTYYIKHNDAHGLLDVTSQIIASYCLFVSGDKENTTDETKIAEEISELFTKDAGLQLYLASIYSSANLRTGLDYYIAEYKPELVDLVEKLGASKSYVIQIKAKLTDFSSWLWNKSEINGQIDAVFAEYQLIDAINGILYQPVKSIDDSAKTIHTKISAIKMPYEFFKEDVSGLRQLFPDLIRIYRTGNFKEVNQVEMLHALREHIDEYKKFDSQQMLIFGNRLKAALDADLSEEDKVFMYSKAPSNSIEKPLEEYIQIIKFEYEQYRKTQKFNTLRETWQQVSESKTPASWSDDHKIPILCLFGDNVQLMREIFDLINAGNVAAPNDKKVDGAIKLLRTDSTIKQLKDSDFCNLAFINYVGGEYSSILSDIEEIKRILQDQFGKGAYDWFFQKIKIDKIIKSYAEDKYKKEYVKGVLGKIDNLEPHKAKTYLKELIKNEPLVGIKIMKEG